MSKGKALCCELRTGSHMETPHVQRVVRTQKPSLNRVQKFIIESYMCVCTKIIGTVFHIFCVCVCVCVCV